MNRPSPDQLTPNLKATEAEPQAAEQILPLVYDELRRMAAHQLASEAPGQTLQATALVHEAYLRLVGRPSAVEWDNRGHFFAAAAEAMRRILIERARRKGALRHGSNAQRIPLDQALQCGPEHTDRLLEIDAALSALEQHDAQAAGLVKLRYFAGMQHQEAADALGISRRAADRLWALARAWLYQRLSHGD